MVERIVNIKDKKVYYLMSLILHLISFTSLNIFEFNSDTKIITNLVLILIVQILLAFIFKFDFIFFVTFLTSFLLMPLSMVYYKLIDKSLGDLTLNIVPIHLYEDTIYVYMFIISISIFSLFFNINFKEHKIISLEPLKLNDLSILFNNLVIYVFTIVAFPRLDINSSDRFTMLLPGHAWNQLVIVAIIFNLPYILKRKSVMISTSFAFVWYSLNGERADISGLMLGILILVLMSSKIKRITKFVFFIIFIGLVLVLITVGTLRISDQHYSLFQTILSIASFSTVSDISYLMNVTVDYIHHFNYTGGKALLSLLSYIIPFTDRPGIATYINKYYPSPGGTPIISPALLDGGGLFIVIYSFVYSILLSKLLNFFNNRFVKYEFLILVFSIPRLCWYGIYFVFPSLIFFGPFLYFCNVLINEHVDSNKK